MSRITAGPGDEATWGPCVGHPNDPRTEDSDIVEIGGKVYDFGDSLAPEELAELLEAGQKVCEKAGIDWHALLDDAIWYIRNTPK